MNTLSIILLSIGLAMDAFAVSISCSVKQKEVNLGFTIKISLMFGLFQAFMPLIGFFIGSKFMSIILDVKHWISFAVFILIGIKMIIESFKESESVSINFTRNTTIIVLAIATSIDALAAGFALPISHLSIWTIVLIIGLITFSLSFFGGLLADKLNKVINNKAEIIGGVILIVLGVKSLIN